MIDKIREEISRTPINQLKVIKLHIGRDAEKLKAMSEKYSSWAKKLKEAGYPESSKNFILATNDAKDLASYLVGFIVTIDDTLRTNTRKDIETKWNKMKLDDSDWVLSEVGAENLMGKKHNWKTLPAGLRHAIEDYITHNE